MQIIRAVVGSQFICNAIQRKFRPAYPVCISSNNLAQMAAVDQTCFDRVLSQHHVVQPAVGIRDKHGRPNSAQIQKRRRYSVPIRQGILKDLSSVFQFTKLYLFIHKIYSSLTG